MLWENDLIKDIRSGTDTDNQDILIYDPSRYHGQIEVTDANRQSLFEYFTKVKDNCRAILEIGVCRNDLDSFTHVFLNNKNDHTIYIGIDLNEKRFLDNSDKNIHTIWGNSHNYDYIERKFKQLGIEQFDFIFIDGDHSINGVIKDWEYTKYLGSNGIVGLHDINWHYGPRSFVEALDQSKWNLAKECPNDWGVGFVWRK